MFLKKEHNVSLELLKEKKIDLRPDLIGVAWDLGNEEIEKYIEDCEKEIARVLDPESGFLVRSSMFGGNEGGFLRLSEEESMMDMFDRVHIYKAIEKDENI